MKYTNPPFYWIGSKYRQLKHLLPILEGCRHKYYIEPFGGSAVVLLNKKPVVSEVYNDSNGLLCNFFRCLRSDDKIKQIEYLLDITPFCFEQYEDYRSALEAFLKQDLDVYKNLIDKNNLNAYENDVTLAYLFFYCMNIAYGGRFLGCFGREYARANSHNVTSYNARQKRIKEIANRFKSVCIDNYDALDLITNYDNKDTLFYLDPPYNTETSYYYKQNIENIDVRLVEKLAQLQGYAVLSCYDNPTYQKLLDCGFQRQQYEAYCSFIDKKYKNDKERAKRIETIYYKVNQDSTLL